MSVRDITFPKPFGSHIVKGYGADLKMSRVSSHGPVLANLQGGASPFDNEVEPSDPISFELIDQPSRGLG